MGPAKHFGGIILLLLLLIIQSATQEVLHDDEDITIVGVEDTHIQEAPSPPFSTEVREAAHDDDDAVAIDAHQPVTVDGHNEEANMKVSQPIFTPKDEVHAVYVTIHISCATEVRRNDTMQSLHFSF